ncbi:MAG: FHA domain-containing protein [Bradymonadaceae bacterium]|nr:FHA domain-containing protein [Lujinxingiaceae bacterium]
MPDNNNRYDQIPRAPTERTGSSTTLPFALPGEEEEDADVFSSARSPEEEAEEEVLSSVGADDYAPWSSSPNTAALPAISSSTSSPSIASLKSENNTSRPWISVHTIGGGPPQRVEIRGSRFLIGRERADLALNDRFVSRWHAQIFIENGGLMLEDLGSHNGIYLRVADDFALEDRDEIIVGCQRLIFRTRHDESPDAPRGVPSLGAPMHNTPRLILALEDGHIGAIYPVGDRITIGRQNADVVPPQDDLLSKQHAAIHRRGDQYFLHDMGSQNGTFIRVRGAVEVIDGDCFMIGRTRLSISYP